MKGKKSFAGGLSSLLGETTPSTAEAEARQDKSDKASKEITKTSQIGTKEAETRATFIVQESILEKVKAVAYWERLQIKDVVDTALTDYLKQYEKTNGPIQSVPAKK